MLFILIVGFLMTSFNYFSFSTALYFLHWTTVAYVKEDTMLNREKQRKSEYLLTLCLILSGRNGLIIVNTGRNNRGSFMKWIPRTFNGNESWQNDKEIYMRRRKRLCTSECKYIIWENEYSNIIIQI